MDSNHTCLAVISLDPAFKKDENYYPQVFLKECRYIEKEKKEIRHINENLSDICSSDEYDEEQIEAIRLMTFETTKLKMYFLRQEFIFFKTAILSLRKYKLLLLKEQIHAL